MKIEVTYTKVNWEYEKSMNFIMNSCFFFCLFMRNLLYLGMYGFLEKAVNDRGNLDRLSGVCFYEE